MLYSEIDSERREVRRVEVFRDGRKGYASRFESDGVTRLAEKPHPEPDETLDNPELELIEIEKEEFERVWSERK